MLARFVDWNQQDIAEFLGVNPSSLSRNSAAEKFQDPLSRLAAAIKHLLDVTGGDMAQARAWLRTPIQVLDGKSPKEMILGGQLDVVRDLLNEMEAGFAA